MLPASCCGPQEDPINKRIHQQIEKTLRQDREEYRHKMKIILLGSGEAGKSTILKQIQMIHGKKFSDTERASIALSIQRNVIDAMQGLLRAMNQLSIPYQTDSWELKSALQVVQAIDPVNFQFDQELVKALSYLWAEHGVQECYDRKMEFYLMDSAKYFLDKIGLIGASEYLPTDDDIMHVRAPTTGIIEYPATFEEFNFLFVDVGGQKGERRKWINAFDNVTSVFFVASLSEYNQSLVEDPETNRMNESLNLFSTTLYYPWFKQAPVILFLNKEDLLLEKLPHSYLGDYFPDFQEFTSTKATSQLDRAKEFIKKMYVDRFNESKPGVDQKLYPHYTCGTDRNCVETVYGSVRKDIMNRQLKEYTAF